jgi:hypothetical protein
MGTDVSTATLSAIAGGLDSGAASIEGIGGGAPGGVDAGVMTAFISSLMGTLADSAAGVSEGLSAAASEVRAGAQAYGETDAAVQTGFGSYRNVPR